MPMHGTTAPRFDDPFALCAAPLPPADLTAEQHSPCQPPLVAAQSEGQRSPCLHPSQAMQPPIVAPGRFDAPDCIHPLVHGDHTGAAQLQPASVALAGSVACRPEVVASAAESGGAAGESVTPPEMWCVPAPVQRIAAEQADEALRRAFEGGDERSLCILLEQFDAGEACARLSEAVARHLARILGRLICKFHGSCAAWIAWSWLDALVAAKGLRELLSAEDTAGLERALQDPLCTSGKGGEPASALYHRIFGLLPA
eukprot:NODE_18487_length_890_cov_3.245085.p1 GENE.NODE_18487_length_890_cov_3.245085~~NODE_18487_length_890_cov_3.245085.p1  ORF type:complete len:281 (+),score=60.58 NODE_18487_length_890_cov_3.245085:73-843(+)